MSESSFENKVAVITGAGSGIGRALAVNLAGRGCKLALADIDSGGLEHTLKELPSACEAKTYSFNVSERTAYHSFAKQFLADFKQVDIVINNAGIVRLHSIEAASYEDYETSLNVNFWGVLYGCKEFIPHLKKRPEAWLVNVSSGAGLMGWAKYSSYNISKFAVRGLTESLRCELRGTSVTVCCVYPGGVDTNLVKACVHSKDAAESVKQLSNTLKQMKAETAAEIIVRGMLNKRARILVGRDAKMLDTAARLFPGSYERILSRG